MGMTLACAKCHDHVYDPITQRDYYAMKAIFDGGHAPGLVAWREGQAVGWIQVDRRSAFPRLESFRVLKPVDHQLRRGKAVAQVVVHLGDRLAQRSQPRP